MVGVHAKDVAAHGTAVAEDGWAVLGRGVMDWGGLFAQLRVIKPDLDLFVFEHDQPTDGAATLAASRQFMRACLGV